MPGSNWHTYIRDPDGHTVELYYGMEQIGWDGRSKPEAMYYRAFREQPELPQISEEQEVSDAVAKGIDINCRQHHPGPQQARNTSSRACACRGRSRSPTSGR